MTRSEERGRALRALGGYGTLGIEIVLSVLLPFFLGRWGDERLGTDPLLALLGLGFGGAAAVRAVLRETRRMRLDAEREEREEGNPRPVIESAADRAARRREREPHGGGATTKGSEGDEGRDQSD